MSATLAPDPASGSGFHPLNPVRIVDSRVDLGFAGPLSAGVPQDFVVAGINGVDLTASAVAVNLTVTDGTDGSFVTLYPAGMPAPKVLPSQYC